jgi:hypothetical protein
MKRVIIFVVILGIVGTIIFFAYKKETSPPSIPVSTQTNNNQSESAVQQDIWPQNNEFPKNAIVQETTISVSIVSTHNSISIDTPYTIIENDGYDKKLVLENLSIISYSPIYDPADKNDVTHKKVIVRRGGEPIAEYNISLKLMKATGEITAAPKVTIIDGECFSLSFINKKNNWGIAIDGIPHLEDNPNFRQTVNAKLHIRLSSWKPNN